MVMVLKVNPILSQKIKYYRTLKEMTQEDLASEIKVEPQHISCVERGSKYNGRIKLDTDIEKLNGMM